MVPPLGPPLVPAMPSRRTPSAELSHQLRSLTPSSKQKLPPQGSRRMVATPMQRSSDLRQTRQLTADFAEAASGNCDAGAVSEVYDVQLQTMVKLEGECAEAAANEKKLTELVHQMKWKVEQFQRQNERNVVNAEEELTRLSEDLQRSTHAQHELNIRAQEGEGRILELRGRVNSLLNDHEILVEQRTDTSDECARVQRHIVEAREAKLWTERELQELELEAQGLESELCIGENARAQLVAEIAALRGKAARRQQAERAELIIMESRCDRLQRSAFIALARICPFARRERQRLDQLRRHVRWLLLARCFSSWKHASQLIRWLAQRELARRRACLQEVFRCWRPSSRRGQIHWRLLEAFGHSRRALVYHRCVKKWRETALRVAELRELRQHQRFCQEILRRWRRASRGFRKIVGYLMCASRIDRRNCLVDAMVQWGCVAQVRKHLRHIGDEVSRRRRRAALAAALGSLTCLGQFSRRFKNLREHFSGLSVHRLKRSVFESLVLHWERCRNLETIGANWLKQRCSMLGRRMLPALFESWRVFLTQTRNLKLLVMSSFSQGRLQAAAVVLPMWSAVASRDRRSKLGLAALHARRQGDSVLRWRAWISGRNHAWHCQASSASHVKSHQAFAQSGALRWWAWHAKSKRHLSSRRRTIASRCCLSTVRWVLILWDECVRLSLRAACDGLLGQIDAADDVSARFQVQRTARDEAERHAELARLELMGEVKRKASDAHKLRLKVAETEGRNDDLLRSLEEERAVGTTLDLEVSMLQKQLGDRSSRQQSDPVLASLEAQLTDALDVQGSLRFQLLRVEQEAQATSTRRDTAETRVEELQERLTDSKRAYVEAIDVLDRKSARLEQEAQDAEESRVRLEKELDSLAFQLRMCDIELQRWR